MEQLPLKAASEAIGSITLPGSKSISNRTLLLAALANGETEIFNLLKSDDTDRMLDALSSLGVECEQNPNDLNNFKVSGVGGNFPEKGELSNPVDLFLGNAGTAFRPLTAALAFSNGYYYLHGIHRMHERPIGDLIDALRQAGAQIEYLGKEGFPPLLIKPADLLSPSTHLKGGGAKIQIRGDVSSQFLTALLMALPLTNQQTTIEVVGELISKPYIEITLNLMARFGINVTRNKWESFNIPSDSAYKRVNFIAVEGDASSASYFLAAGAIAGQVTVQGIGSSSIQGDVKFADELKKLGVTVKYRDFNSSISSSLDSITATKPNKKIKGFDLDCNHIPDAAMTLAILALFADGTTTLRNIASWRVKETDRIAAMATELRKVGATVVEGADYIQVTPPAQLTPNAVIDTYDDHRMAMCFSLISLAGVPITINDPKCVGKTFPEYFKVFASIAR